MKSNLQVIKNETANFLSHTRALQIYLEGRAGPTCAPQDYTKTNLSINGEPQHTAAHFLDANLWQHPKE